MIDDCRITHRASTSSFFIVILIREKPKYGQLLFAVKLNYV